MVWLLVVTGTNPSEILAYLATHDWWKKVEEYAVDEQGHAVQNCRDWEEGKSEWHRSSRANAMDDVIAGAKSVGVSEELAAALREKWPTFPELS